MHATKPLSLLALAALIGAVSADSKPSNSYSCVQGAAPIFDDVYDCSQYTTKDSCLSAVATYYLTGPPAASCSWRKVDARSGDITDTHFFWYYAEYGGVVLNNGLYTRGDSRFGDFCSMETEIALPKQKAAGYEAQTWMTGGTPLMFSFCAVGQIPGRECESKISLPYGVVPDGALYASWTSYPVFLPTTATSGKMSMLITNKFKMSCNHDDDRRRASRRLASYDSQPWFRYINVDQVHLGGPSFTYAVTNIYGGPSRFELLTSRGMSYHAIDGRSVETIKVDLEVQRPRTGRSSSTSTYTGPVHAYVIRKITFDDYAWFKCGGLEYLCTTPLTYAIASCTAIGKKCTFTATLDSWSEYYVVISKPTIGFPPDQDPAIVEYKVDAIDRQLGASTALAAADTAQADITEEATNFKPFTSQTILTSFGAAIPEGASPQTISIIDFAPAPAP